MDFSQRTALEYLSLQNNERTHAEMLAWLVSEHSGLGESVFGVLRELLGPETFPDLGPHSGWKVVRASTEEERIDFIAELEHDGIRHAIVIEYKMKSVESEDQLQRYDAALPTVLPRVSSKNIRKILLTVAGESPRSGNGWFPRTYAQLRAALALASPVSPTDYLRDYLLMVDRILYCMREVQTNGTLAAVLLETSASTTNGPHDQIRRYVEQMKIVNLVAKSWFSAVAAESRALASPLRLLSHRIEAGGAIQGGGALINVYLAELTAGDGGVFRHGLQVQGTSFKAFVEPYPDRLLDERGASSANMLHAGLMTLKNKKKEWTGGTKQPVSAGERGHRSIRLRDLSSPQSYAVRPWADAIVRAIGQIRRDFTNSTFPEFAWKDLAI